ncbi:MAG: GNAT family N-acetyltransferase [Chloroflexi bacterium]|nr:MAG: GNAT family N-acetyltransferase [Chloroflexota bacterium]
MAIQRDMVVSICHTPAVSERGAEAGVWTRPEFRGQGYAVAVTAAWATLARPSGRHLFYSTAGANVSSQRVAARLGLRPLGWLWQLTRARTRTSHQGLAPHGRSHPAACGLARLDKY